MSDSRQELRELINTRRRAAGLTWTELAEQIGGPPAHTIAALFGQHPLSSELAAKAAAILELSEDQQAELSEVPSARIGSSLEIPADPTIYRFYEALGVYGEAVRALIHDEFGDGIMSAINFQLDVKRVPHPDGDRVEVVFNGKFLDYKW
jgi:cyanate lyase